MFKRRTSFKNIILGLKNVATTTDNQFNKFIKMDKVLILSKLSRYEFEKRKHNIDNDHELEKVLRKRGTDFEKLIDAHNLHKNFEKNVINTFYKMGLNVEVVNRFDYSEEKVAWADIIVPTGGDGTFLLGASKIRDNSKPVIGFNSDPSRSEGHLCLPKKYSTNIRKAVERLQKGDFEWLLRSRIRIKVLNRVGRIVPKSLHEHHVQYLPVTNEDPITSGVLPVLALNEVFIGETTSSRVSHLQLRLNGSVEKTSLKCSGVCVCTGTGSTSWHMSINRLSSQTVSELLELVDIKACVDKEQLAENISDIYNKRLIFKADDHHMCYTIRDLISAGVWPSPKGIKPRSFVSKLEIKSNCFDAYLVVDGGVAFDFNDGTIAVLQIKPEDTLRTVLFKD